MILKKNIQKNNTVLFPRDDIFPPGFSYFPYFINGEEEQQLITAVQETELHSFTFRGYKANRKVKSFGYDYHFDSRSISQGDAIPTAFHAIINKVAAYLNIPPETFAELLVTEYPPGAVINWHRDAPPFDLVAGISLATDCTFRLRPYDKAKQTRSAIISFSVQRRSLYIIDGEARSDWEHSITPVKQTRYSITLRTLRTNN